MRLLFILLIVLLTLPAAADDPHVRDLGIQAAILRELSYHPIKSRDVTQAECSAYLKKEVNEEMKPDITFRRESFLRHLGFIQDPRSLKQIYLDLLADQVRGLYDPKRKIFLVVHSAPSNLMERGAGLLFSMMGVSITDVFTVHEMDHAVGDQHFDLQKIEKIFLPTSIESWPSRRCLRATPPMSCGNTR